MKAVVMTGYGGPEKVEIQQVPEPAIGHRDVLIEVHAAALNPVDYKIRNGMLRGALRPRFPQKMGLDVAGIVLDTGMRARIVKPGTRVFARVGFEYMGTFAEEVTAEKTQVAAMPDSLSFEEAAGIPLAGLTAWQCLVDTIKLQRGQRILIHAGAGGVGTLAIQIAKHLGAHVTTTASARNHAFLKGLGADDTVDYTTTDFTTVVKDLDAVLDAVGGETLFKSFGAVKPGGIVVSIAALPDDQTAKEMGLNLFMRLSLKWMNRKVLRAAKAAGVKYRFIMMKPSEAQLRRLAELVEQGVLRPVIDSTYALDDVRAAMEHLEAGHCRGKVVLKIRGPEKPVEQAVVRAAG